MIATNSQSDSTHCVCISTVKDGCDLAVTEWYIVENIPIDIAPIDTELINRATMPEASDPIPYTTPPPRLRRKHQGLWADG